MIAFIFEVWPADGRVNDYDQPSRAGFDRRHHDQAGSANTAIDSQVAWNYRLGDRGSPIENV